VAEQEIQVPLWRKLALLTATFAIIPAAVIAWSLLDANEAMIKQVSREVRLSATSEVSQQLDAALAGARGDSAKIALALSDPQLDKTLRIPLARTLVAGSDPLDHAAIFDAQGKWIDTITEGGKSAPDYPKQIELPLAEPLAKHGGLFAVKKGRAQLVTPLKPSPDKITGYLLTEVELDFLQAKLEELVNARFDGNAQSLLVLDRDGFVRAHVDDKQRGEKLGEDALLAWLMPMTTVKTVAVSGEFDGSERWLVTAKPLEEAPWLVVARVTQAEAYAPLVRMRWAVLVGLLLTTILSCIAALLLARRFTRPVSDLVKQCIALAQREFGARVHVDTRDEFSVLGHTLNHAAQSLAESEDEIRRQELIRAELGRYLPRNVVEQVSSGSDLDALRGRRAEVTVLFADIVGFTPLCESRPPEVIVAILNEFFTIATEIVFRHGGVVDKFVGDCVMAFWGAPSPDEEHAEKALMAAEDLISWLDVGNARWREQYGVEIEIAVGVHSGEALVGNVGSESRVAYTVIGEVVNLAARLESIARPNQILITSTTATLADDMFDIVQIGTRNFPGIDDEVMLCEVRL
jgi:class 3 adenylate cyclase/methionine-rich copper-binding protein CopC